MPKRSRSNSAALIEGGLSAPPAKRFAYSSPPPSTRRSDSAAPSGCSLPLTYENIGAVPGFPPLSWRKAPSDRASSELPSEAEAKAETCGPIISRSGSPTRKNWDESTKLAAFNTKVDSDQPYPADLQRHVDTVLLAHIPGPRSPNAHRICDQRKAAALQNEPGANTILRPWLLFEGELPSATQPVPRIASQANLNLARDFLPRPPKPIVQVVYGALSQPQPDTAIGYLTPTEANASTPPLATAFSHDEQLILTNYTPAQRGMQHHFS
ncbi:hypothetical protein EJ02DRAFT_196071 [Clathrospora elynae]|uniref:Uncharacterized protein n=1 Tax=Clathrospora elynae TaxID=706981 RepID=A0A6A5T2F2_9PLEO|nr:hypothetical protein EJ02DRAFT_196071 [Clathrospora elynae]